MKTITENTGHEENQDFNFKEADNSNFQTDNDYFKNSPLQNNASHSNALKDQANRSTVEKANENFDLLITNAQSIDQKTKALMLENKGLIRTIFPNKMDRLLDEMSRNMTKESLQFQLNLYKLNTQFVLEGLREKYDAGLKMVKAEYRSQVASFMMGKLEWLSNDVQNRQYTFIQSIREKNQLLKSMTDIPSTAKRYADQIEREQDRYFNFMEQLIINFENIIREELVKFN